MKSNVKPVAFGSQITRFTNLGLHPGLTKASSTLDAADTSTTVDVGPGTYDPKSGNSIQGGANWKRQQQLEKEASLPCLLNKEKYLAEKERKTRLGPGCYFQEDPWADPRKKTQYQRGILDMKENRFKEEFIEDTPGPGWYGKYGIPHAALYESEKKSFGTVGLLENSGRDIKHQDATSAYIGPGSYNIRSEMDENLKKNKPKAKSISYSRYEHIPVAKKIESVGPGYYNPVEMTGQSSIAKFGLLERFNQKNKYKESIPSPGHYDVTQKNDVTPSKIPFNSTSSRGDLSKTENTVGVGRYDIAKYKEHLSLNGHVSSFKSCNTLTDSQANILRERLMVKNHEGKVTSKYPSYKIFGGANGPSSTLILSET